MSIPFDVSNDLLPADESISEGCESCDDDDFDDVEGNPLNDDTIYD
jgi:hypothetical protein